MAGQLYIVDVEAIAYVVADSEEAALKLARENRHDILSMATWSANPNGRMMIHGGWNEDDYPYGPLDDERTLAEWLEEVRS